LDGSYSLRSIALYLGMGLETSLFCPGFVHGSVVLLLEH
jgi:hypothetical protein